MKNLRGDILNLIYFQNKGLREKIRFGGVRKNDQFGFDLSVAASEGPLSGKMTYFYFVVRKKHSFIRNIFEDKEIENCEEIITEFLDFFFKVFFC